MLIVTLTCVSKRGLLFNQQRNLGSFIDVHGKSILHLTLSQTSHFFTCLHYKSFENTVTSTSLSKLSTIFIKSRIVVCKLFNFEVLKFVVWKRVKKIRVLWSLEKEGFLKHFGGKKEKMLVTSIFSFFPKCFISFQRRIAVYVPYLICRPELLVVLISLNFGHEVKI